MAKAQRRKLTTIFCADVSGFGQHMAKDEDQAFGRLQRYRSIMESKFDQYNGRLVNTWGDAFIAEFASVVEAVRCAVDVQDAITSENSIANDDGDMIFRIGINLGDVMVDGDDLYGEGVNVAARLEAAAPAGGILVSRSVYDLTHKQLAIGFDYLGEQAAKDGEEAIATFVVRSSSSNRTNSPTEKSRRILPNGGDKSGLTSQKGSWFNPLSWFTRQRTLVQLAAIVIVFVFMINAFFSGLSTPWFIFPSFGMLAIILIFQNRDKDPKR